MEWCCVGYRRGLALWQSGLLRFPVKELVFTIMSSNLIGVIMLKDLKKRYGIGNAKALSIITYVGLEADTKYSSIPKSKLNTLNRILSFLKNEGSIENTLRNKVKNNIKLKINVNSLKGKRHKLRLPVRGQRTRSNGSTAKRLNHKIN